MAIINVVPGEFALKPATEDVRSLKGMIRRPVSPVSIDAMNAAITRRRQPVFGLDTNALVRYIAQDDHRQAAKAAHVIEEECSEIRPGFIAAIVLAELVWVLESCYGRVNAEIVAILQRILRTRQLAVQDAETICQTVRSFEASTADFSDCLIERIGVAHECETTTTFDKHAASTGMRLIE